jgi:hypothetical protein
MPFFGPCLCRFGRNYSTKQVVNNRRLDHTHFAPHC